MIDPRRPFASAKLKIMRANRHMEELKQQVDHYLTGKPFILVVEETPGWTHPQPVHSWIVRVRQAVPPELSGIIGDVIHNLRASLDLLACDLVRLNGKKDEGVCFPFCKSRSELSGAIRSRHLNRAGPDAVKVLMGMELFPTATSWLRVLHDLDIRDKHQAIIPAISGVATPAFALLGDGSATPVPEWTSTVSKDGQILMMMPALANLPPGSEVQARFGLVFDKLFEHSTPIDGMEVIPAILTLTAEVERTLESFVSLYAGDPKLDQPWTQPAGLVHRGLIIGSPHPP